jgi:hypothetical protein
MHHTHEHHPELERLEERVAAEADVLSGMAELEVLPLPLPELPAEEEDEEDDVVGDHESSECEPLREQEVDLEVVIVHEVVEEDIEEVAVDIVHEEVHIPEDPMVVD